MSENIELEVTDQENLNLDVDDAIVYAVSPTATVTKTGDTATITITDKNGTTSAQIHDGQNGAKGDTGDQGPIGPSGPTGPVGPTPNISIGTVSTLDPGSDATVTIAGTAGAPVLNFGIPEGDKGDTGDTGETGAAAGFGTVSATVDSNVGTPSVTVTASGPDTAKEFAFAFSNMKGETGQTGATGNGIASIELTSTSGSVKTYTITYTNGNSTTFNVTDGEVTNASLEAITGDLTDLETTDKTDIVSAINEVNGKAEDADENADTADEHVGDLSELETEDKTSAVDAINEVLSKIPVMTKEVTGNPITVDDALGGVQSLTVELTPIQEGSGTPSPQNVRPITGHDSVKVGVTGKNMLDAHNWQDTSGGITVNGDNSITIVSKSYQEDANSCAMPVLGQQTYMSFDLTVVATDYPSQAACRLFYKKADGTIARPQLISINLGAVGSSQHVGIAIPTDAVALVFGGWAYSGTITLTNMQLELGSAESTYESYYGHSTTVTLPSTVYGGDVDVTGGAGTEKYRIIDLGTLSWEQSSTTTSGVYRYYTTGLAGVANKPSSSDVVANIICSNYGAVTANQTYNKMQGISIHANGNVFIYDDSRNTLSTSDFKTAMNGVMLCYELATPTDLITTPTDITLYNGDNTVSADGDMDMVYVRDIVKVIEKLEG